MPWPPLPETDRADPSIPLVNIELESAIVGTRVGRVTSTFSIPTATLTEVEWNAEDFDTDSFHDNTTNPARLTIPDGKAGTYLVNGQLKFAGNTTGVTRAVEIKKNGTRVVFTQIPHENTNAINLHLALNSVLVLTAGDYLTVGGYQDSGGSLAVTGTDLVDAYFQLVRMGS